LTQSFGLISFCTKQRKFRRNQGYAEIIVAVKAETTHVRRLSPSYAQGPIEGGYFWQKSSNSKNFIIDAKKKSVIAKKINGD
jgi:hypothetical protein